MEPSKLKQIIELISSPNGCPTHLDLCGKKINDAYAIKLAKALAENRVLQSLNLWHNQIGNEGAKALANALIQNRVLHSLNLENNQIGDEGAVALANALVENKILLFLNLNANQIGNIGAAALAEVLVRNRTLQSLYLGLNQIDNKGAEALAKALAENRVLQSLNLWHNQIGNKGIEVLMNALAENHSLLSFNLLGNQVGKMAGTIDTIKILLRRNYDCQESLKLNWGGVGILTAFRTANFKHRYMDSILPLINRILQYTTPTLIATMRIIQFDPFINTRFHQNSLAIPVHSCSLLFSVAAVTTVAGTGTRVSAAVTVVASKDNRVFLSERIRQVPPIQQTNKSDVKDKIKISNRV